MTIKETIVPGLRHFPVHDRPERSAIERRRSRWLVGLFLAAALGLSFLVLGISLSVLHWFGLFSGPSANGEITALLGLSFPLFFGAAHCMDKIRELEKSERRRKSSVTVDRSGLPADKN